MLVNFSNINPLFDKNLIQGMVTASRSALLGRIRMISLFIFIPWSIVVMITRVTDYWHFPTDVIGGILLGILPVHFLLRRRFTNPSHIFNNRLVVLPHGNWYFFLFFLLIKEVALLEYLEEISIINLLIWIWENSANILLVIDYIRS